MTNETKLPEAIFFELPNGYCMRPLQVDDVPYLYLWVNDPETRPYHNRGTTESLIEEMDWVQNQHTRKATNLVWMIVGVDGCRIGTMGLHNISWKDGTATTGAIFGSEKHRNQGIGTLAKMALLNHAFNVLNLRMILSEAISFNLRSINYSLKCGYVQIGSIPNWIYWEGQYYDYIMLTITKADFEIKWSQHTQKYNIKTFSNMLARHGQLPRK